MIDIHKWRELSDRLKTLKADEMKLRREICDELSAEKTMKKGRITVTTMIDNLKVTSVQSISYSLDLDELGRLWQHLNKVESNCVKMVPTLKLAEYKALPSDNMLQDAIIGKLAAPTLKYEIQSSE